MPGKRDAPLAAWSPGGFAASALSASSALGAGASAPAAGRYAQLAASPGGVATRAASGHARAPGPSQTPAGTPAAAAGGAAASGLSIFLMLAGLELLGGPRVRRRLRLWIEPWRMAPFVLIPERPS